VVKYNILIKMIVFEGSSKGSKDSKRLKGTP
jgi:hypothetical protein